MNSLLDKRFNGFQTTLDLCCIDIQGSDAESYLQGQTTNCVLSQSINSAQYNCLLNRQGKIEAFFVLSKLSKNYFKLWISPNEIAACYKRLNDFIVADDVELKIKEKEKYLVVSSILIQSSLENSHPFLFLGEKSRICENLIPAALDLLPQLDESEIRELYFTRGFYSLKSNSNALQLLNETIANEIAWNHQKGCFLGQEVVQKIYTRRGAAKYPYMLKVKGRILEFLSGSDTPIYLNEQKLSIDGILVDETNTRIFTFLPREYQLLGLEIDLKIENNSFKANVEKISTTQNLADEIYHLAIELFSKESKHDLAINLLQKLISHKEYFEADIKTLAEWHETLGAIYGKTGMYTDAMDQMHKVIALMPDEVMPYTNLSLYAMKLGYIEEAEKFKEEATVKSFFKLGQVAKKNKADTEKILAREKMFKDVLEIDEFDAMALCGLAEIHLSRNEALLALEKINKLQSVDDNYTQSYILLGLAQESLGRIEAAKSAWIKGRSIALGKGELMPAQQIQAHLQKYNSQ